MIIGKKQKLLFQLYKVFLRKINIKFLSTDFDLKSKFEIQKSNKNMDLAIGTIFYNNFSALYLRDFFNSLALQNYSEFKLFIIDNSEERDNENFRFLKNNEENLKNLNIDYEWMGANLGFSKAYNRIIEKAHQAGAKYFLVVNPDMIFEPDMIMKLILEIQKNSELASVSPKVMQWDFLNKEKTKIIDTCGIVLKSGLSFVDVYQGERDRQINNLSILGPSGAAGLYRMSALEKIKNIKGEYFDESFFMYKEDCDLAYRLFLAGFKSKCVFDAICYHDRSASSQGQSSLEILRNRKNKSAQVRKWSFRNQHLLFWKYWSKQNLQNRLLIIFYILRNFIFACFFERDLLGEYREILKRL